MNFLKKRYLRPEIMDDPKLEEADHQRALQGLHRINVLSGIADRVFHSLTGMLKKNGRLKVLDAATGGGDIPITLAKKAARHDLPIEIGACDKSDAAMNYARCAAKRMKVKVDFFQCDVLKDDLPEGYDVIVCQLFLHHLSLVQTREFLKKMSKAARHAVLVNDLQRCWPGFILAACIPPLLTGSEVVRRDSVQSVRAAYSFHEIIRIAKRAGLNGSQIKKVWPFRYQLLWEKT